MTKNWLLAIRPKTLFASASPVFIGLSLAYKYSGTLNIKIASLTLVCAVLLQILSNLVNDYYDGIKGVDSNSRLGPIRVTSQGLISSKSIFRGIILLIVIILFIGSFLMFKGGLPIILIGLSSIFFAYIYTGGPYPLSYFALGEFFAIIFFGPIPVWGTHFLQTNTSSSLALAYGLSIGFISAALMAINNLRDIESDNQTKKKTLALMFGEKNARKIPLVCILVANIILFFLLIKHHHFYTFFAVLIVLFLLKKTWTELLVQPISSKFNMNLAKTGQYLFIFSIIISVGVLFE